MSHLIAIQGKLQLLKLQNEMREKMLLEMLQPPLMMIVWFMQTEKQILFRIFFEKSILILATISGCSLCKK